MREIEFRGKRADNGEWVYGYYAVHHMPDASDDNETSHGFQEVHVIFNDNPGNRNKLYWTEVNYRTVGQFTGLYDKNNKKIYEHDIIELTEKLIDGSGKTTYVGNVVCQNACFHFRMDKINYIILGYVDKKQIKIIGNIHDNPELMK